MTNIINTIIIIKITYYINITINIQSIFIISFGTNTNITKIFYSRFIGIMFPLSFKIIFSKCRCISDYYYTWTTITTFIITLIMSTTSTSTTCMFSCITTRSICMTIRSTATTRFTIIITCATISSIYGTTSTTTYTTISSCCTITTTTTTTSPIISRTHNIIIQSITTSLSSSSAIFTTSANFTCSASTTTIMRLSSVCTTIALTFNSNTSFLYLICGIVSRWTSTGTTGTSTTPKSMCMDWWSTIATSVCN